MTPQTNYLQNILGNNENAKLALRELKYFRNSSDNMISLVYQYAKIVTLDEGEILIKEGEFDQWVYFTFQGRLGVYVEDERVDSISPSMVGERCILGEPRKATLKAEAGGIKALGIDMAILDVLEQDEEFQESTEASDYIELMSMITGEAISRIAELWFNQLEVRKKYLTYLKTEDLTSIIHQLKVGAYKADRRLNFSMYRFLQSSMKEALYPYWDFEEFILDTPGVCSFLTLSGDANLLNRLALVIFEKIKPNHLYPMYSRIKLPAIISYGELLKRVYPVLLEELKETDIPAFEDWELRLKLDANQRVHLEHMVTWLKEDENFSNRSILQILTVFLEIASALTAQINSQNRSMLEQHEQVSVLKKEDSGMSINLEKLSEQEILNRLEQNNVTGVISKQILSIHLIQPYLEKLLSTSKKKREPILDSEKDTTGKAHNEETVDIDDLFAKFSN